jgi:hypothetical protein
MFDLLFVKLLLKVVNLRNLFWRRCGGGSGEMLVGYDYEAALASGEKVTGRVANFGGAKTVAAFFFVLPAIYDNFAFDRNGLLVLDVYLGGYGAFFVEFGELAHGFVEDDGDDSTVSEASAAGVVRAQGEAAVDAAVLQVELKGEFHAGVVGSTTAEAVVGLFRVEFECCGQSFCFILKRCPPQKAAAT